MKNCTKIANCMFEHLRACPSSDLGLGRKNLNFRSSKIIFKAIFSKRLTTDKMDSI